MRHTANWLPPQPILLEFRPFPHAHGTRRAQDSPTSGNSLFAAWTDLTNLASESMLLNRA